MTAADDAYTAAQTEIARAARAGEDSLSLIGDRFEALESLPPEIGDLENLFKVTLENTRIANIAPLSRLHALNDLSLAGTLVEDLTPLHAMGTLQILNVSQTNVSVLKPLEGTTSLQKLFADQTSIEKIDVVEDLPNLDTLSLNHTAVVDLKPIVSLKRLQGLSIKGTAVSDFVPIADTPSLRRLLLGETGFSDLSFLGLHDDLHILDIDKTDVEDIAPLAGKDRLYYFRLSRCRVSDLRPVLSLPALASHPSRLLDYAGSDACQHDHTLAELSRLEDRHVRTDQTFAYLHALPPWPEPLPWEIEDAKTKAPAIDPVFPLKATPDGIDLDAAPLGEEEAEDTLRQALFEELCFRVEDLVRISANQDDSIYREACRLRDQLDLGLQSMASARVHLMVEALRRAKSRLPTPGDGDLVLALDAVLETGPGLTLGTPDVTVMLERQRENRLLLKDQAETDAEIRIAQSIAQSDLAAPTLRPLADAMGHPTADDQLTGLRAPLAKNWTTIVAASAMTSSLQGVTGNASYDAVTWLVVNADDVLLIARFWGEPVLAWVTPILQRAREMAMAWEHLTKGR